MLPAVNGTLAFEIKSLYVNEKLLIYNEYNFEVDFGFFHLFLGPSSIYYFCANSWRKLLLKWNFLGYIINFYGKRNWYNFFNPNILRQFPNWPSSFWNNFFSHGASDGSFTWQKVYLVFTAFPSPVSVNHSTDLKTIVFLNFFLI